MAQRVLVAGCGYVGSRLAGLLVEEGAQVLGMRRDPAGLPPGVRPVAADVTEPAGLCAALAAALSGALSSAFGEPSGRLDAVVYAVSPGGRTAGAYRSAYVDGLRNVLEAVRDGPGLRVVLVTSTGVYGHTDGRVVREDTDPEPPDATAELMLEAEALARSGGRPGVALRLGGIYGPGRTRTIRRVLAGEAGCPPPDRYANRIHRDDAAGALLHLLKLPDPEPVYLGVDREPAPLREVYRWIAERAGAPDPCREDEAGAREAPGRRGTNKRCSSERLVASGYAFRYPTFREGYGALLDESGV